jgi:hypothetical protein
VNLEKISVNNSLGESSISSIDVSGCQELSELDIGNNAIEDLELGNASKLSKLVCNNNKLSKLDLSANTELKSLNCKDKEKLADLDLTYNRKLGDFTYDSSLSLIGYIPIDSPIYSEPVPTVLPTEASGDGGVSESGEATAEPEVTEAGEASAEPGSSADALDSEEAHNKDVENLTNLATYLRSEGANVSMDVNSSQYKWDSTTLRLTEIDWNNVSPKMYRIYHSPLFLQRICFRSRTIAVYVKQLFNNMLIK